MVEPRNILVCGVNWIGDAIMMMPALQVYRKTYPETHISLLIKPGLKALWQLHAVPDDILLIEIGLKGTAQTVKAIKERNYERAYVLPHSFRSAVIPRMAGIPERWGMPGHSRDWMLTQVIDPVHRSGRMHQAFEYMDVMMPDRLNADMERPELAISDELNEWATSLFDGLPERRIGIIPGAARGSSKQWPKEHFIAAGRQLTDALGCGVAVFGTPEETALCSEVAAGIGSSARSLAGKTGLAEWVAALGACDLVIANDSGGMHVAAALNTPVVALYGMTDPAVTGPLTKHVRILQRSDVRSRDIARHSETARAALEAIRPEEAVEAARSLLDEPSRDNVRREVTL